jgi:hypothetical protein
MVVVKRQADLFQIVLALAAAGGFRACCTAGSNSAIKMAMIAITTKSSIRVKPRARESR